MENEKRHTAGPWEACDPELWRPGDPIVVYGDQDEGTSCDVCEVYPDPDDGDRDANVRLITAAPELLAALKAVLPLAAPRLLGPGEQGLLRAARAAIAKAEGRVA